MSEYDRNQEVALRIRRDLRWNGRQFKLGDYVGLLDADVVAVADNPEDVLAAVRAVDPNPSRGMMFEVASPVQDVIR